MKALFAWLAGLFRWPEVEPSEESIQTSDWLTPEQFQQATGISQAKTDKWYQPIKSACLEFDITGSVRIAAYLAQIGHESGGFVYTREIWGPTKAQLKYEGRPDLGNTNIGDGRRFLGRGLIQITGRSNYQAVSKGLGVDFVADPVLLEHDVNAARSAAWWWANNGCNAIADTEDFQRLTRRINGGLNGLDDRLARWNRAKQYV